MKKVLLLVLLSVVLVSCGKATTPTREPTVVPTEIPVQPTPIPSTPTSLPTNTPIPTATRVLPTATPTPQFDRQADMGYVLCVNVEILPDVNVMNDAMYQIGMMAKDGDIEGLVFWYGAWEKSIQTVKVGILTCPAPKDNLLLKHKSDTLAALDEYTEAAKHGKAGWQRMDVDEIEHTLVHVERAVLLEQSAAEALIAYIAAQG